MTRASRAGFGGDYCGDGSAVNFVFPFPGSSLGVMLFAYVLFDAIRNRENVCR